MPPPPGCDLTYGDVSGGSKEGVEQNRVERRVQAVNRGHGSQQRVRQTWGGETNRDDNRRHRQKNKDGAEATAAPGGVGPTGSLLYLEGAARPQC